MKILFLEERTPLRRLPGLFRRWELAEIIDTTAEYHVERTHTDSSGLPLYSIFVGEGGV